MRFLRFQKNKGIKEECEKFRTAPASNDMLIKEQVPPVMKGCWL